MKDEGGSEAHLAAAEDEDPALLMAQVTPLPAEPELDTRGDQLVQLHEEGAEVSLRAAGDAKEPLWHLDTGASNHMTGNSTVFSELDRHDAGTVRFGDGSVVEIEGRGTVVFVAHGGRHRVLSKVYYIPRLRTSIISVGQLDEAGCTALVRSGMMVVRDRQENIIANVYRSMNRLYTVELEITRPVCLTTMAGEDAWRWHAHYGH